MDAADRAQDVSDNRSAQIRERSGLIALAVLTLIGVLLCVQVAYPFLPALAWAVALAVIAFPMHLWIARHVRNGNWSAAEGTFRSQAAVSAAMQDLEQQLGAPLFEPGKRAQLTPLGAAVAPLFRELLSTHDRVLDAARQLSLGSQGPVSLAVMERAGVVGFMLVILIFLIGLSNDIGRLSGEGFQVR